MKPLALLLTLAALLLCLAGRPAPAAAARSRCYLHGSTPVATVHMCITHLDATHCKLIFRVHYRHSGIEDHFGGVVRCGGSREISDPGDRRPK